MESRAYDMKKKKVKEVHAPKTSYLMRMKHRCPILFYSNDLGQSQRITDEKAKQGLHLTL